MTQEILDLLIEDAQDLDFENENSVRKLFSYIAEKYSLDFEYE